MDKENENNKLEKLESKTSSWACGFLNTMSIILSIVGFITIIYLVFNLTESIDGFSIIVLLFTIIFCFSLSALLMGMSEIIEINLLTLLKMNKQNNNKEEQ